MKEYFSREDAVNLCVSYQHLIYGEHIHPSTKIKYIINFIVPVPANKVEMEEFRELVAEYLQTNDRTKLFKFDQRQRKDEFIPVLFGRAHVGTGANLLSVAQCSFVDQAGQMKYGFEIFPNYWLH